MVAAIGMALIAEVEQIDIGFACIIGAGALSWIATARFENRRPSLGFLTAGALIWLAVAFGPADLTLAVRVSIYQFVLAFFVLGAAFELWRGRGEQLKVRLPMIALVVTHGFAFVIGGIALLFMAGRGLSPSLDLFAPVNLEIMIYAIGAAIFFVALVTERQVNAEKAMAQTDWLTGLFNRGAFVNEAEKVMARSVADGNPVTGILFDLDRFKEVNDTFGHAAGDTVLQRFAAMVNRSLRRMDIVGRIGGEHQQRGRPGACRAHPDCVPRGVQMGRRQTGECDLECWCGASAAGIHY